MVRNALGCDTEEQSFGINTFSVIRFIDLTGKLRQVMKGYAFPYPTIRECILDSTSSTCLAANRKFGTNTQYVRKSGTLKVIDNECTVCVQHESVYVGITYILSFGKKSSESSLSPEILATI